MPQYYRQIGDAVGDAMARNARQAAELARDRAEEDAARDPLCRCGHTKAQHQGPEELGSAQCLRCPGDDERTWRHPYSPEGQQ